MYNKNKLQFVPDANTGCLSDEDTKKYLSRFGWAVFGLGIATELAATLLVYLLKFSIPHLLKTQFNTTLASHLVSFIAIYAVALPVFLRISRSLPSASPIREKMGAKNALKGFCMAVGGMMAGSYISSFLIVFIESLTGITTTNPLEEGIAPQDPAMVALTVIFMVILAPILEEIFFRKIMCRKLLPLGEGYAILISAAVFGLFHGNFYQFAYGFIVGLFFGFIYVKTGRLGYSIAYHMGLNLMGSVIGPWIVSKIDLDKLEEMLIPGKILFDDPAFVMLFIYSLYSMLMTGLAIAGCVFFFSAVGKGGFKTEQGILPPPKKGRLANFFCNVGVAAAIAYFVITMAMSIIPIG